MSNYDLAVFIGRFQILHSGHMAVIAEALSKADNLAVLVGSAKSSRSHRNPFTFQERRKMILESVDSKFQASDRLFIAPIVDTPYNDALWISDVQSTVNVIVEQLALKKKCKKEDIKVCLIGHCKDSSSYYVKIFVQWGSIEAINYKNMSSSPMRSAYFSNIGHMWLANCDGHVQGDNPTQHLVPTPVRAFLDGFLDTPEYKMIRDEYEFILRYKTQWAVAPYPVTFVTTDAVVISSGHVLMIKRGGHPGKGSWALPGGFLGQDETIENGMLRELQEETGLRIPSRVLRGSIVTHRVFDDPQRSARGRTITYAYLIKLRDEVSLPMITAGDDAVKAKWIALADLDPTIIFEDHYAIIQTLIGQLIA